jgi:AcrR family transcriptional regulator
MTKAPDQDLAEERGVVTRRRILEATIDLIADGGWEGVTTRAVGERAGVNAALVHYHFGSLASLREAAIAAATASVLAEPMTTLMAAPTLREGMRGALEAIDQVDERTMRVLVEVLVRAGRDETIRAWLAVELRTYRALIEQRIAAAQAAGELPGDVDPAGLGIVLAAIGDGLALHALVDHELATERGIAALDRLLAARAAAGSVARASQEGRADDRPRGP